MKIGTGGRTGGRPASAQDKRDPTRRRCDSAPEGPENGPRGGTTGRPTSRNRRTGHPRKPISRDSDPRSAEWPLRPPERPLYGHGGSPGAEARAGASSFNLGERRATQGYKGRSRPPSATDFDAAAPGKTAQRRARRPRPAPAGRRARAQGHERPREDPLAPPAEKPTHRGPLPRGAPHDAGRAAPAPTAAQARSKSR